MKLIVPSINFPIDAKKMLRLFQPQAQNKDRCNPCLLKTDKNNLMLFFLMAWLKTRDDENRKLIENRVGWLILQRETITDTIASLTL